MIKDRQSDRQTGRWKNIPLAITAFWRAYSAQSEGLWELVSNVVCQLHPIPSESKFPGDPYVIQVWETRICINAYHPVL